MTVGRISLPAHGAVETALGLLTVAAPFVLGLGAAATVLAVVVGALVVAQALTTIDDARLRVAEHLASDRGLVLGCLAGALAVALLGQAEAAVLLSALGVALLALLLSTRYSARA